MVEAMLIQNSLELNKRLSRYVDGLDVPSCYRSRFANGLFSLTMDCHNAIILLINKKLHGPSFALLRVICEALIRGYWFHWCANDHQLSQISNGQKPGSIDVQKVLDNVKKSPRFNEENYAELKGFLSYHMGKSDQKENKQFLSKSKMVWKAMNSYTHGTYQQLSNYQSEYSIEPNFDDDAVREVVWFADYCSCWAAMGVCETADKRDTANKIYDECIVDILRNM